MAALLEQYATCKQRKFYRRPCWFTDIKCDLLWARGNELTPSQHGNCIWSSAGGTGSCLQPCPVATALGRGSKLQLCWATLQCAWKMQFLHLNLLLTVLTACPTEPAVETNSRNQRIPTYRLEYASLCLAMSHSLLAFSCYIILTKTKNRRANFPNIALLWKQRSYN